MSHRTSSNTHTSAATLLGVRVLGPDGKSMGRVRELIVDPAKDTGHVAGVVFGPKIAGRTMLNILSVDQLEPTSTGDLKATGRGREVDVSESLFLDRDLLDQQIIDMNGRKVVRVNDVDLCWEKLEDDQPHRLRIAQVEVGLRGAARRLLKGLPRGAITSISETIAPRVIPWDFVDLIERDPGRRVRLKIEQNRLASMHPSDIADILEELAPAEREAVFASLDEEVAAEALEEVDPKLQKALIEGLDSERVADIVEEMDPGAAADLLAELSEERSDEILEEMDPEERQEVEDLLEFPEHSAAGRMTTDYVSLREDATVADAIQTLKDFEGDVDLITDIFLLDAAEELHGVVAVSKLIVSDHQTILSGLAERRVVSTTVNQSSKHVAELFDKYNLRSLAVIDDEKHLAGVIYAEHVISLLREGR